MSSDRRRLFLLAALAGAAVLSLAATRTAGEPADFSGRFYSGRGDVEYLRLLDTARRMFEPDPRRQNMPMLYYPAWNGLVEGPTWDAWWIQNSYGPTYCALPFWQEPFVTFMQNSQDLWFDQMGDGKHVGGEPYKWVAPDGCLCDAARPGWIYYKQGDGRVDLHDWGMEFTAAGVVLQAEALLIGRDRAAIGRYLPKLERCADFLESRRDPKNNLYLAGAAGNLLAPSYAGWKKPDGTYDKAYLAGLSITTIAALDRLIELEKMAGRTDKAGLYAERRQLSRQGLPRLMTDEGYFIKSLDPDGTRHGVYGAARHGYFEAVVNHDAVCFRVADDAQAEKIYAKIASLPGLRPYDLIITNYPSLDDLYTEPKDLWEFGRWVNGGHWSTCEARMIMGYYRLGRTEDARRSMKRILGFADRFRMDNNLTNFGGEVYQPKEPINCVYDAWGIPAGFIRGLFEYLYRADRLEVIPHIPAGITRLDQKFPIRFGAKQLFLSTAGSGPVSGVLVNGRPWAKFDGQTISLPYDEVPAEARIQIALGGAAFEPIGTPPIEKSRLVRSAIDWNALVKGLAPSTPPDEIARLAGRAARIERFGDKLAAAGLSQSYEAAHARLALAYFETCRERIRRLSSGEMVRLPEASQPAADRSYFATAAKLSEGLEKVMESYAGSGDPARRKTFLLWMETRDTQR
jgi:hypothetical protein